jgi:hypothetical protein
MRCSSKGPIHRMQTGRGTARQRKLTSNSQAGGGIALARSEAVCERHLSRCRIDDLLKRGLTRRDIVSAGGTLVAGQVFAAGGMVLAGQTPAAGSSARTITRAVRGPGPHIRLARSMGAHIHRLARRESGARSAHCGKSSQRAPDRFILRLEGLQMKLHATCETHARGRKR